ncbi:MAG: sigma-70 family RNA polymerase sigma factor [Firmicutes bacterium]|nr:sigma-70 family RNA polymerase sigma factor [Bacillota bacterium]
MIRTAKNILGDYHLAEDAAQEAFMRIAGSFSKLEDIDSLRTRAFVIKVVKNVSINMLERIGRQPPMTVLSVHQIGDMDPESQFFDSMDYESVISAINSLPKIYSETMRLYYIDEFTTAEIAERLKISVETVKKRLQRGRKRVIDRENYNQEMY